MQKVVATTIAATSVLVSSSIADSSGVRSKDTVIAMSVAIVVEGVVQVVPAAAASAASATAVAAAVALATTAIVAGAAATELQLAILYLRSHWDLRPHPPRTRPWVLAVAAKCSGNNGSGNGNRTININNGCTNGRDRNGSESVGATSVVARAAAVGRPPISNNNGGARSSGKR